MKMNDREIIRQKVQSLRQRLGEQRDINLDELITFIDSLPEQTEENFPKLPQISPKVDFGFPLISTKKDTDAAMAELDEKVKALSEAHRGETADEIIAQMKGEPILSNVEEPISEDLEEAANNYVESIEHVLIITDGIGWRRAYKENNIIATFKAGANWQKRKDLQSEDIDIDNIDDVDLENLEYPKDYVKGYSDGFKNAKQQMMKEAITTTVIQNDADDGDMAYVAIPKRQLNEGDKIKLIIIK